MAWLLVQVPITKARDSIPMPSYENPVDEKSLSSLLYTVNESVLFILTTRNLRDSCERDPVAEEKKVSLKDRLKGKAAPAEPAAAAPTGAPIIPGKAATPAPFPVIPSPEEKVNGAPNLPPIGAPSGVNLPPAITPPVVGGPVVPLPMVNLPGLELPPPPPQPVAVQPPPPAPVYKEPDPIIIDPYAGSFKLDDDEANRDFEVGKSLGWIKLAAPAAVVGIIVGFVWGKGTFQRDFNEGRAGQVQQFKEPFEGLSKSMDAITKRVLDIKDGDKIVDVKFPTDLEPLIKDINMLSGDSLKQYNATFLRADTLSLLMQYRYLTDLFYKTLLDHKKKVENTKDDLMKAAQGSLGKPKYVVVLLDQSDQGGIVSGNVCTMRTEPKVSKKMEDEVLPDDAPEGTKPKKVENTYKTYTLQSSFETKPFERESLVKEGGVESVREIINQDLIPDYSAQLLFDYQERVKNLKTMAKVVQDLQTKTKAALEADAARTVSF
jgi:hypothetical protein